MSATDLVHDDDDDDDNDDDDDDEDDDDDNDEVAISSLGIDIRCTQVILPFR